MKAALTLVFILIIGAIGWSVYNMGLTWWKLSKEYNEVAGQVKELENDNARIADDTEYFSNPHNLSKELRSRNYRLPNEKLFIIVPEENQ